MSSSTTTNLLIVIGVLLVVNLVVSSINLHNESKEKSKDGYTFSNKTSDKNRQTLLRALRSWR